jgi:chromosome segregation ATPase
MKTTFLTNLLIVLALGLCALCTYQWLRETNTRVQVQSLHDTRFKLESAIQQHTNNIRVMDARIAELTDDVSRLVGTVKTNTVIIADLRNERSALESSNAFLGSQLHAYTNAFIDATNRLYEAHETLRRQNDQIKELVVQRDDFLARLNESIQAQNRVVEEYNNLVKKVEEFQKSAQPKPAAR